MARGVGYLRGVLRNTYYELAELSSSGFVFPEMVVASFVYPGGRAYEHRKDGVGGVEHKTAILLGSYGCLRRWASLGTGHNPRYKLASEIRLIDLEEDPTLLFPDMRLREVETTLISRIKNRRIYGVSLLKLHSNGKIFLREEVIKDRRNLSPIDLARRIMDSVFESRPKARQQSARETLAQVLET
jgi:hypothetical protein